MTLIVVRTEADHADILTDTRSYTPTLSAMGWTTKVTLLAHLDGAAIAAGDGTLINRWKVGVHATEVADFDGLVDWAEVFLPRLWDNLQRGGRVGGNFTPDVLPWGAAAMAYLVGYSPRRRRFTGYVFDSLAGFARQQFDDGRVYALPVPRSEGDAERMRPLTPQPIASNPSSDAEWVALATKIREERCLDVRWRLENGGVPISGDVIHTRLEDGAATQRRIHRFNESGKTWLRMIAGTAHPDWQRRRCRCGSGRAAAACHWDRQAPCCSGKPQDQCCLLPLDELPVYLPDAAVTPA